MKVDAGVRGPKTRYRVRLHGQQRSSGQTIFTAFADVEFALNEVQGLEAQAHSHAEELAQARCALALAEARARAGAETLLTLLEAQRALYAVEDEAVRLKLARLATAVSLYKALGGGWQRMEQEKP
jgi:outer membrane protein TolC